MLPTSKIKAVGLLAAVAVAGFAAGAATMSRAETVKAPTDWRERCSLSGMLKDRLKLSDQQRDSIRAIMRSHRGEMHALMDKVRPQMDSVRGVVNGEVRAVLSPAQRIAYDSLQAEGRAEHARLDSARSGAARPGATGSH